MDINTLFEETNKEIMDKLKKGLDLFSDKEKKEIKIIFDTFPKIKNKSAPDNIKKYTKHLQQLKNKRADFVNKQSVSYDYYSPQKMLERKKEGVEPMTKHIDTIKKYAGQEIMTLLRGTVTELSTYNMMLDRIKKDVKNEDKTIPSSYKDKQIFNPYHKRIDKIIAVIKAINGALAKLITQIPDNSFEGLEYSEKIKDSIIKSYDTMYQLEKDYNSFKTRLDSIKKAGKDRISKLYQDIEKKKKEIEEVRAQEEKDPEDDDSTNRLLNWMMGELQKLREKEPEIEAETKRKIGKAYRDFEEEDFNNKTATYFSNFKTLKGIIDQKGGQIAKDLKNAETNLKRTNIEIEELEKNPVLSDVSEKDYMDYDKILSMIEKDNKKIGNAKKFIESGEYDKFVNKIKETEKWLKGAGIDKDWFKVNYWKIKYGNPDAFDILNKIFFDKEVGLWIKKKEKQIKDDEKYQTIKKYNAKAAPTYMKIMLTLDTDDNKARKEALENAEKIYQAAKEIKGTDVSDVAAIAQGHKENQEEYNQDKLNDNSFAKDTLGEFDKEEKELKNKKKKNEPNYNDPYVSSRAHLYEPSNDTTQSKAKLRLLHNAGKHKEDYPELFKEANYLFNKNSKIKLVNNVKNFNKEKEALENNIDDIKKQIEILDTEAKKDGITEKEKEIDLNLDKNKIPSSKNYVELGYDPDFDEVKKVSEEEKKQIKSDFDKLNNFTKRYIVDIKKDLGGKYAASDWKLGNKRIDVDWKKRDTKKEFRIKKGLINLVKRVYKDDSDYRDKLIREIQKSVEPYQKEMGVKKLQDYKFMDVIDIFKNMEKTIDELKNYSSKEAKRQSNIELNTKYKDYIEKKEPLKRKLENLETVLDIFNDVGSYIETPKRKTKKINENTKTGNIFKRIFEELKK